MQKIKITGGKPLFGEITVSGAKNSVLPILSASILTKNRVVLENVPDITDVENSCAIIRKIGGNADMKDNIVVIDNKNTENFEIPENESIKMRSSVLFCGALLGRFKKVFISGTGGCNLGKRPIDLHLKAFKKMGAKVKKTKKGIYIEAENLKGAVIEFEYVSVGATENTIIAATLAEGRTIIKNAAKEPEICDLACFLNTMGADIIGAGTETIVINGVRELKGCVYRIMPDRIEAGTYLCAAAATGGHIVLNNVVPIHLKALTDILVRCGCIINSCNGSMSLYSSKSLSGNIKVKTEPFPLFPTDLQAPLMTVLAVAKGSSTIEEKIFSLRNGHIKELNKMGADIKAMTNRKFSIKGKTKFKGACVSASDLRAGAALVIAGLCAEGDTIIDNAEYIYRGYENLIDKLKKAGAEIESVCGC